MTTEVNDLLDALSRVEDIRKKLVRPTNGASRDIGPRVVSGDGGCVLELRSGADFLSMSDSDVEAYLRLDGAALLFEAYRTARSINVPRAGGCEISVGADSKGGVDVKAGCSIRF